MKSSSHVRHALAAVLCCAFSLDASVVWGAQPVALHNMSFFVHTDLVMTDCGDPPVTDCEDLVYWQNLLDEALVSANLLVEGGQGPVDTPCCSRIAQSAPLATFGAPGDGLDVIDSRLDQMDLGSGDHAGPGSNAFLVDSIDYCGGSAPGSVGCAQLPMCSGNGDDNPNLWMAITSDAYDRGILSVVIAHERGHNSCLEHTNIEACQIMRSSILEPGNAGCFLASESECINFRDGRTTTSSGLECSCHAIAGGIEADGTLCSEFASGLCSGGLCGESAGDAGLRLIAAAHPGSANIPAPDDALTISALSGDWSTLDQISAASDDVFGLAYATDSGTLFGVVPTSGDDSIVTIDPDTGNLLATVGSIANGSAELISMAYHPGATSDPGDDRLIMLEVSGSTGTVVWIDPASPSVKNIYGNIIWIAPVFRGLAYDSIQGKLFASTPFAPDGLYEIDLSSCPPAPCDSLQVVGVGVPIDDGSLAFSAISGKLYQFGTAHDGLRTFYNVIDPMTGSASLTLSLDRLSPGGLAAIPEPGLAAGLLAGSLGLVLGVRWRQASRSSGTAV